MNHQIPTATIYLGTPFFNEEQQERVKQARALLEQNPTVLRVHFPFDQNYVDPNETEAQKQGIRSLNWQLATYNNDLNDVINASCGVFLYDMDELDDGCAFEIGFMRAYHKPVVLVPFTNHPEKDKRLNLMLAQGVTALIDGNTELDQLASYDFNSAPAKPITDYQVY